MEEIIKHSKKQISKIAMCMMVKNEKKRLEISLRSCLGFINNFIIYDTGSTDETIGIVKSFCSKYKINLYLKHGTFVDFSTSRNVLLTFADTFTEFDYLLLMDCNDELRNGKDLIKFCNTPHKETAFFLKQSWKSGIIIDYFNIRLIKPRNNWKYKGVVHEYIENGKEDVIIKVDSVVLFQDRTQDDDKSAKRYTKDKELLLSEYNSDNKTTRTVYYLAQTYECLTEFDLAIDYYEERLGMEGFFEEKYQAAYHIAMIMRNNLFKKFNKYSGYLLIAFSIMHRAEPLVRIAEHYISVKAWSQAYYFLKESCSIDLPLCGLFVDAEMYHYYRWHLMGIVAFYVKKHKEGYDACVIAVKQRNHPIDVNNLNVYKKELNIE